MDTIEECSRFLSENASGRWFETTRFKNENNGFMHRVSYDMVLLRVNHESSIRFYWIYDISDAIAFNDFVTSKLNSEAHEVITGNNCRLFYDIDLKLNDNQKYELLYHYNLELLENNETYVMDMLGEKIAHVYKNATLISLEEHGNDRNENLINFEWMFCMRNRPCEDEFKISIHIITNLFIPLNLCSAILDDVKHDILFNNCRLLEITESIADYLSNAIDSLQCRSRGSLGLPLGCKKNSEGKYYKNFIVKQYDIPHQYYFITIPDDFSIRKVEMGGYNILTRVIDHGYVDSDFIKRALDHVNNIDDFDSRAFDVTTSVVVGSTMYVKRYTPSYCSVCNKMHDNDNTLYLIFNSERLIASWKCFHAENMIPIQFYSEEDTGKCDESDIEAFAKKYTRTPSSTIKKCNKSIKYSAYHKKRLFVSNPDTGKSNNKNVIYNEYDMYEEYDAEYKESTNPEEYCEPEKTNQMMDVRSNLELDRMTEQECNEYDAEPAKPQEEYCEPKETGQINDIPNNGDISDSSSESSDEDDNDRIEEQECDEKNISVMDTDIPKNEAYDSNALNDSDSEDDSDY